MLEYLRDPLWQFIGAAIAAVALLAMFLIYKLQRTRKGVLYEVISRTSLLTVREELEGKLQVLYEGEPAKSLTLIVLKMWNSGNQPILSADFERPISFCTGDTAFLLTAAVTQVEPSELVVDFSVSNSRLTVTPVLLNPGDSVTFKLLVRDAGKSLSPDARIAGVKSIKQSDKNSNILNVKIITGTVLHVVGLTLLSASVFKDEIQTRSSMLLLPNDAWVGMVLVVGGLLITNDLNVSQVRRILERLNKRIFRS